MTTQRGPAPLSRAPRARLVLAAATLGLLLLGVPAAAEDFETCWAAYEADRWSEAVPCFEGLMQEYGDWAWGHHYLGVSYHGAGRADDAQRAFETAADLMEADESPGWDPFYMLAVVLEAKGQHRAAMDALKRGESYLTPEQRPDYLLFRGQLSYALGAHAAAIADLRESGSRSFEAQYLMGVSHYEQEDFEAATDALEAALRQRPDHGSTAHFLSLAFFKRAEATSDDRTREQLYGRAAEVGRSLLAANPRSAEAHNLLGRALMGSGDYAGAQAEFLRVLELQPGHCFAQANLTKLALVRSRWGTAIEHGERALRCLDGDARRETLMDLGFALAGQAKGVGEGAGDDDVATRQRAIAVYERAAGRFREAAAIRASAATRTQLDLMTAALEGLREEIGAIERNRAAAAENERIAEEERRRQEAREAVQRARGGDGQ